MCPSTWDIHVLTMLQQAVHGRHHTRDLVTGAVEGIPVGMITDSKDAVAISEVIFKELQSSRRCHREKVEVSEQKVRVGKGEVLSQLDQGSMDECTTLAHDFLVSSRAMTRGRIFVNDHVWRWMSSALIAHPKPGVATDCVRSTTI